MRASGCRSLSPSLRCSLGSCSSSSPSGGSGTFTSSRAIARCARHGSAAVIAAACIATTIDLAVEVQIGPANGSDAFAPLERLDWLVECFSSSMSLAEDPVPEEAQAGAARDRMGARQHRASHLSRSVFVAGTIQADVRLGARSGSLTERKRSHVSSFASWWPSRGFTNQLFSIKPTSRPVWPC